MDSFLQQHQQDVSGMISGWDRLRFRGTLRMLANVTGMDRFLAYTGHLLKDFGSYALELSRRVRCASLAVAQASSRPVEHLRSPEICKEDRARQIAARDGVSAGLIGVLGAVEPCWSYNIQSNPNSRQLELVHAYRKCQHLYHYQIHPVFGFMHVRLQTWLPLNLHVCINGREWLARQMDAAGIAYRRADNCFTWIADPQAAQRLLDQQVSFDFAAELTKLAGVVNPLLKQIVGGYKIDYYWSLDESEWASDVSFHRPAQLSALYPSLIRHGIESFGARETMRFLGRSVSGAIPPRFAGEVVSDLRCRPEGMRLKHRLNRNSIKMYDKAGVVLRVETTLNNMRDLQSPRIIKGKKTWCRMRKGVADIPRRAQVSQAANQRYLQALATVKSPRPLKVLTEALSQPKSWKGKRVRGLNLLGRDDANLLQAVGRAEFLITGLRNRDLQSLLYQPGDDPAERRRRSGQVTRKLRLLRAHGLIHKVSHTHRYLLSDKGRELVSALHAAREADIDKLLRAA